MVEAKCIRWEVLHQSLQKQQRMVIHKLLVGCKLDKKALPQRTQMTLKLLNSFHP